MRTVKLRIVVLKALFDPEPMLLVELLSSHVVFLDVKLHAGDLFVFHAVFDGLNQEL